MVDELLSKSSLVRLVNEYGGKLVAEQAVEAEAMVNAPERGEEIVWRDIPEPDSEVMVVSLVGDIIRTAPGDTEHLTALTGRTYNLTLHPTHKHLVPE